MVRNIIKIPERLINARNNCDVLVAGVGTDGCAAAIAAAKNGTKTIIIEQLPLSSGIISNEAVIANSFYSSQTQDNHDPKQIVASILKEIIDRIMEASRNPDFIKIDPAKNSYHRPYIISMNAEIYKVVLSRMLIGSHVKLYLHTFLLNVITKDKAVNTTIIQSKLGRETIQTKYFIDYADDGNLVYFPSRNTGKIFSIANVDVKAFMGFVTKDDFVNELAQNKKLGSDEDYVRIEIVFKKSKWLSEIVAKFDYKEVFFLSIHGRTVDFVNYIRKKGVNGTNIEDLTKDDIEMQEEVLRFCNFARTNPLGFENSIFSHSANQFGIRMSRIVKCY
jgi:hypothetical protein